MFPEASAAQLGHDRWLGNDCTVNGSLIARRPLTVVGDHVIEPKYYPMFHFMGARGSACVAHTVCPCPYYVSIHTTCVRVCLYETSEISLSNAYRVYRVLGTGHWDKGRKGG